MHCGLNRVIERNGDGLGFGVKEAVGRAEDMRLGICDLSVD